MEGQIPIRERSNGFKRRRPFFPFLRGQTPIAQLIARRTVRGTDLEDEHEHEGEWGGPGFEGQTPIRGVVWRDGHPTKMAIRPTKRGRFAYRLSLTTLKT